MPAATLYSRRDRARASTDEPPLTLVFSTTRSPDGNRLAAVIFERAPRWSDASILYPVVMGPGHAIYHSMFSRLRAARPFSRVALGAFATGRLPMQIMQSPLVDWRCRSCNPF